MNQPEHPGHAEDGGVLPALLLPGATRAGRSSNLAFALRFLPARQRRDLFIYYAFCREVDDIADSPAIPVVEKRRKLGAWLDAIENPARLPADFREVLERSAIPPALPAALVLGCIEDLEPRAIPDFAALREYCWKVAVSVGLAHNHIVGVVSPGAREYAESLGMALQLVNILRDVGEDARMARVYLPLNELAAHGVRSEDLHALRETPGLIRCLAALADRAEAEFLKARNVLGGLPDSEKKLLRSAEAMRRIYSALLRKIRRGRFAVLEKRFRLSFLEKLRHLFF